MNCLIHNIQTQNLFKGNALVLVALSGGADSVALLSLLNEIGFNLRALHCNFHLRGTESDRDEAFVRRLCQQLNVPLDVEHFETMQFAKQKGISIEMAAREMRYEWFRRRAEETGAQAVAVAHHMDDQAETLLLNLLRGTGLRGLAGMSSRQGIIVRPLLNIRKTELLDYLREKGLDYVTDSTNLERQALRNRLRLDVMPLLNEINGQAVESLFRTAQIVRESLPIYNRGIRELFADYQITPYSMPLSLLRQSAFAQTLLHEWLSGRGFSNTQEKEVLRSLDATPGRRWDSASDTLLLDRNELLLRKKSDTQTAQLQICQTIVPSISETGPNIAYFDADLIHEPLTTRLAKTGDYFYPLGLGRRKLLSDFMTDRKLSLFAKQAQVVLCHGEDIIWLVGLRSDHRYRVTQQTKRILKITYTSSTID